MKSIRVIHTIPMLSPDIIRQPHKFFLLVLVPLLMASCSTTSGTRTTLSEKETWIPTLNRYGTWDNAFGGLIEFTPSPPTIYIPRADAMIELYKVRDLTADELETHRFARYADYSLDLYFSAYDNRYISGRAIYYNYSYGSSFNYVDSGAVYRLRKPQEVRVPNNADDRPPYANTLSRPILHDIIIVRKTWDGQPSRPDSRGEVRVDFEEKAPFERIHFHRCAAEVPARINFNTVRCAIQPYERFRGGVFKP